MKVTLTLNAYQVGVLRDALDLWSRIHTGDIEEVVHAACMHHPDHDRGWDRRLLTLAHQIREGIWPELGSAVRGIRSKTVPKTAHVAYDMLQVLRKRIYDHRYERADEETREWMRLTVSSYEPWPVREDVPLVEVEVLDEEEPVKAPRWGLPDPWDDSEFEDVVRNVRLRELREDSRWWHDPVHKWKPITTVHHWSGSGGQSQSDIQCVCGSGPVYSHAEINDGNNVVCASCGHVMSLCCDDEAAYVSSWEDAYGTWAHLRPTALAGLRRLLGLTGGSAEVAS